MVFKRHVGTGAAKKRKQGQTVLEQIADGGSKMARLSGLSMGVFSGFVNQYLFRRETDAYAYFAFTP
jgi:hypothetical protein